MYALTLAVTNFHTRIFYRLKQPGLAHLVLWRPPELSCQFHLHLDGRPLVDDVKIRRCAESRYISSNCNKCYIHGILYLVYDPAAAAVDENPDAVASMSYVGSDHTFLNGEENVFLYS